MMFINLFPSRGFVRIIATFIVVIFVILPSLGMVTFPAEKCYRARFLFSFKHVPGFHWHEEQYWKQISSIFNNVIAIEQTKCRDVFVNTTDIKYKSNSSLNFFTIIKFTTNENVPLANVSEKLKECTEAARHRLDINGTKLTVIGENNATYAADGVSMRWKQSCCGNYGEPPCCHQWYSQRVNQSHCACNKGFYLYDSKSSSPCRRCWRDRYQDRIGATDCARCPTGTSTCGEVQARSSTSCLAECPQAFCPPNNVSTASGQISWSNTSAGNISRAMCPLGPSGAQATRPCASNGHWRKEDVSLCAKAEGKISQELNRLINENVTKDNAKEIAVKLRNLTNQFNAKSLNSEDVSAIADLLGVLVNVTEALQQSGPDVAHVFSKVLDVNESQIDGRVSKTIVNNVEMLAQNLPVPANQTSVTLQTPNLVISSTKINPSAFKGVSIGFGGSSTDNSNKIVEALTLPQSLFENIVVHGQEGTKLGSVLFFKSILFSSEGLDDTTSTTSYLNSRVISASINGVKVQHLTTEPIVMKHRILKVDVNNAPVCVFWDYNTKAGFGTWSREGCNVSKIESDHVECQCDHMTNFAMLFSPRDADDTPNEPHARVLTIISYIGCGISLFGLILTVVTYALFRSLHKSTQQPTLACLCLSLIILLTVFIAGVEHTENRVVCQIVAALLHYSILSVALWMGVEGYQMYLAFIKVLATYHERFMLKCCAVAWGIPAVVVIVTVATASDYYGNEQYCILTGIPFYAAMFAPVCLIITVNFVIFFFVIWSLGHRHTLHLRSSEQHSRRHQRCLTAIAIMTLLGLTWIFGALAFGGARLVFEYLFCIFNSLQGLFIFIFHCLRLDDVRKHWSTLFSKRSLRYTRSVTSQRAMSTIVERTASRKAGSDVSKRSCVKQVGNGTTANGLKKPDVDKNGHAQVYSNQAYDNDIA